MSKLSCFSNYAEYYDAFYSRKDYENESSFVLSLIHRYLDRPARLLELGCGTGSHAVCLARKGLIVDGIDASGEMVEKARARFAAETGAISTSCRAWKDDATSFTADMQYEVVISLFHVASYQVSNQAISGFFSSAYKALKPGGILIFDFWYGPAVLKDRPMERQRTETQNGYTIQRHSKPLLNTAHNIVHVDYEFKVSTSEGTSQFFSERHSMRYFFLPELDLLGRQTGLELIESGAWLSHEPLAENTWYGFVVFRK